jgi:3-dehydroquinate synthetase
MKLDKKVSGGEVKFVLARQIGEVEFGLKVPREVIEEALDVG